MKLKLYLYQGDQEIGALDVALRPLNFRVIAPQGHPSTVAIEVIGQAFAAIKDQQNNIAVLAPIDGSAPICYAYSSFGEETQAQRNPWRFASKRHDPDLDLINFGKRFYSPTDARWMSHDPAGYHDSVNLYQYVFNNPFKYSDPDGQFVFAIPLLVWGSTWALPTFTAIITPIIYSAAFATAVYAGSSLATAINKDTDKKHDLDQQALSEISKKAKKTGVSNADADTLLEWGKEYDFPETRDDRGVEPQHWDGGEHIHIGPRHIPVR